MDLRQAAGKIEDAIRKEVTVLEDRLEALERQVSDLIEASAPWRSAELEPGGNGDPPRRL
jgi:tetrahydromethanopterin S-methyltransferase subunit B